MKKKMLLGLCMVLFCLVSGTVNCFAETDTEEMKFYQSPNKKYSGYGYSYFCGNLTEDDPDAVANADELIKYLGDALAKKSPLVKKLPKNALWVFSQAMNDNSYKPGDFYVVSVVESEEANSGYLLLAIVKGKDSFAWCACEIDENTDIDNLATFLDDLE